VDQCRPDAVVVSSYDRILREDLLDRCRFINVHYSPLPLYRGRANVNWAIVNGEATAAISIHRLEPGLDAGHVLFQQGVSIGARDTVTDLYARLNELQLIHLGPTVRRMLEGYAGEPQASECATYGCTRLPRDGEMDWTRPAVELDRLVRALTPPFPGAFTYLGTQPLTVWRAQVLAAAPQYAGRIPGRVIGRDGKAGTVDVLAGEGVLRLEEVQLAGQAPASASDVIRSVKTSLGLRTADLLARIEELEQKVRTLATGGEARPHGEAKETT
jgi:methionyl-tRNA formyltransferase